MNGSKDSEQRENIELLSVKRHGVYQDHKCFGNAKHPDDKPVQYIAIWAVISIMLAIYSKSKLPKRFIISSKKETCSLILIKVHKIVLHLFGKSVNLNEPLIFFLDLRSYILNSFAFRFEFY